MKIKKATILMSVLVMLLSLTMAVSCNQNVAGEADRLVRVSLADGSRGLSYQVVDNSKNVDDLYWYYSATKGAGYFRTGETAWGTIKKADGKLEGADLGKFSQGDWIFTFWGFDTAQSRTEAPDINPGSGFDPRAAGLYYYAVGVTKTLSEDQEYLDITLTPGFAIETKVTFKDLVFDPNQYTGVKTTEEDLTLRAYEGGELYYNFGTVSVGTDKKYKFASTAVDITYTSDFGYHDLSFVVTYGDEEVASEELRIYVREGLVTTISGDLSSLERRSDVIIQTVTADKITYQATNVAVEDGKATSIELNSTNKVVFAADALDEDYGSLTLTVDEKKDAGSFVVESDETGILALDLSAAQSDGVKSQFDEGVTVSWYIGKGYPEKSVTVVYNGDLADPTEVTYNSTTGVVTFTTTHFSEFLVKIDGVAQVGDTAYGSIWAAINAIEASDGKTGTVKVLKDLVEAYPVEAVTIDNNTTVTIDLNGKSVAIYDSQNRNRIYLNGVNLTIKNGTYVGDIWVKGSSDTTKKAGDHNTLVLAADAKIIGSYGIILQNSGSVSYGNKVTINGQISGVTSAVWVLGNQVEGTDVVEVNSTAILTASASDATAFALQGKASVTVDGATLIAPEAAISVRAGELTVEGGTFRSTSTEFLCVANGDGTTTKGAAIAITQHTTKLPISVTINGGTFEGIVGLYEANPQHNVPAPVATIALNGGTFKSTENGGVAVCIVDAENTTTSASVVYHGRKLIGPSVINDSTGRCYSSLEDAIAAVGAGQTLVVLKDIDDARGISVAEGKNFTVDFGGHIYTLNKPGAGSPNTRTQGFQLLKNSTIVFKNGTIRCAESNRTAVADSEGNPILMLVQNYSNLTLENMTLDGTNLKGSGVYTLSLNNGVVSIRNTTLIAKSNGWAFDVCWAPNRGYPAGTQVTIDDDSTVSGKIEFDLWGAAEGDSDPINSSLTVSSGKFDELLVNSNPDRYELKKTGNTWAFERKTSN